MGCNQLTDKCEEDPPEGINAFCYEDEGPGGPYCHGWGPEELCVSMAAVGADGLPSLKSNEVKGATALEGSEKVAATDCRGRLQEISYSPSEGEARRRQAAKIVI